MAEINYKVITEVHVIGEPRGSGPNWGIFWRYNLQDFLFWVIFEQRGRGKNQELSRASGWSTDMKTKKWMGFRLWIKNFVLNIFIRDINLISKNINKYFRLLGNDVVEVSELLS